MNYRERIYSGQINGVKFRYSVMMTPEVWRDDEGFKRHHQDSTDHRLGYRLLMELIERGVVNVTEEDFEW